MGWWSERAVPRLTHATLNNPMVAGYRQQVCADLSGDVLEIGFGTGLNLPHLPAGVDSVTAVEPSELSWQLSAPARQASAVPVHRGPLRAEGLDLPAGSVTDVLVTFSLCTVADPVRTLAEARRVLRPGGRLHFLEHGLAPDAAVRRWQRRMEPLQRRLAGGCHLTRAVESLVRDAGFEVRSVRSWYAPGGALSRPWGYLSSGWALAPA